MRSKSFIPSSMLLCLLLNSTVLAQSLVTTMTLGRDQLALVKTSQGITTKISFPERIKEIICGDLYDPADGRGNFVVQRSDNDLFLKPVAATGVSNLFVKTGDAGEFTYSFELLVVPVTQSYRIVNILNGHANKAVRKASSMRMPPVIARVDSMACRFADTPAILELGVLPRNAAVAPAPLKEERTTGGQKPAGNTNSDPPKMNLGAAELESEVVRREKPLYPDAARLAGVTGDVVVEVIVDQRGKVVSATALSGPLLLRHAAVSAARGWRFRPFKSSRNDGQPAHAVSTITFAFKSNVPGRDSLSESRLSSGSKP